LDAAKVKAAGLITKTLEPSATAYRRVADECLRLNEVFNHWIVQRTPFVTVKAAMTLDGKIATAEGESKWITGEPARAHAMKSRLGSDAILVGVNTVLADDPVLTVRKKAANGNWRVVKPLRRIILDSRARTPLTAKVVGDEHAAWTTIVVGPQAPARRVAALAKRVQVVVAPNGPAADLRWLLRRLGAEQVAALLVEGGGEVNASFLMSGLAQRVAFAYAPKILGGRAARRAVAGAGAKKADEMVHLRDVIWRQVGKDLWLEAAVNGV